MAQLPMYPAINSSPQTPLMSNISASSTTIEIASAACLPPPPNICTIGADDDCELVFYGSLVGNELRNCVRGFSGTTARVWQSGELVYRALTAYDHDAAKANIEDLAGEVAGRALLTHKNQHKTGGADALTPADIGAMPSSAMPMPAAHAASHATGAADVITPSSIGAMSAGATPTPATHAVSHATGGTDAIAPSSIGAMAAGATPTPAAHAASHASGGADAIAPGSIGAERQRLQFTNTSVPTSTFIDVSAWPGYPIQASIALNGVISSMTPAVVFSLVDSTSGNFAPIAQCYAGGVKIWAKTIPTAAITIPTIICWEAV